MNMSFDCCYKHGKAYQFIGNDPHCRLNCRICYDCLRETDNNHKKGVANHETISIDQLGLHFEKMERQAKDSIIECN